MTTNDMCIQCATHSLACEPSTRNKRMRTPQRILIVDDHPTNIEVLQEILSDDYVLAIATSGEEALALAPTSNPRSSSWMS